MRIKFFNLLQCLAIFCMVALVSCSKDETDEPGFTPDSFSIDGKKYNTLKEAVEAAAASGSETTVIKLTASTSGDGFTVNEGIVNIDFGPYTYFLNDGKAITATGSHIFMTGNGGSLKANGTVIKGSQSSLDIEGNLNINGDIDVKEMDYCGFWEDYSGVYSGNIKLDDTYLTVEADKAVLNIATLNTVLSSLNVVKAKSVNINNVVNDAKNAYPVRADIANVVSVKSGAEVHVHDYAAGMPFSCIAPEYMAKACKVCDHFDTYIDEKNTKVAECDAEMLEYTAAVAATETSWGNVEHWDCAICGKSYSDSNAKNVLDPINIMIEPTSYIDLDAEFPNPFGAKSRAIPINMETVKQAISGITKVVSFIQGLSQILSGDPTPEEVMENTIAEMSRRLKEIQQDLQKMQSKLESITSQVQGEAAMTSLDKRMNEIKDLQAALNNFTTLAVAIENYGFDQNLLDDILSNWDNGETQRHLATMRLAREYVASSSSSKGVDEKWETALKPKVMFEHEGYGTRMASMIHEAEILNCSAAMAALYIAYVKHYEGSPSIITDLGTLYEDFSSYEEGLKAALERMQERNEKYIVYNGDNGNASVVFNKELSEINVRKYIVDNQAACCFKHDLHEKGCNVSSVAQGAGVNPKFDLAFVHKVLKHYAQKSPDGRIGGVDALEACGFKGTKSKPIAMYFTYEHEHRGDGVACCGNFYWRAYAGNFSSDWLQFRGLIKNDKNEIDIATGNNLWGGQTIWQKNEINISSETGAISKFKEQHEDRGIFVTATVAQ